MTARPSIRCTYPACRCIDRGGQCIPAQREQEAREIEARKAQEPYCSHCYLPESDIKFCVSDVCVSGGAWMIQPEARP